MSEHTCRRAAWAQAAQAWQCVDCGDWREPDDEAGGVDRSVGMATIGVVASVSLAAAAAHWGSPVLGAVIAVPGLLCVGYVLWHLLRS